MLSWCTRTTHSPERLPRGIVICADHVVALSVTTHGRGGALGAFCAVLQAVSKHKAKIAPQSSLVLIHLKVRSCDMLVLFETRKFDGGDISAAFGEHHTRNDR